MGCLKLTKYKQKLPRRWTVLCRDFRQKNTTNYNYQFDYDNIGNRIFAENNSTRTNYSTNELNQYTAENTFIPTYDPDGNQTKIKTSMGEWLVEYNGENRPVKFTQGTKSIEMKYDYMGRRIQYVYKTGNTLNKDRRYMYNGYTLVQEMYNTNQVYMEFTWDPTAGTATKPLMLAFPTEGKNLFYFHDANKNVTEVAYRATHNGIGAHYEYDTFGNIITNTRNSLFNFDSNNINPFRFSSEYFDSELGLVYYNYRHYNPQSGRWISRDPIEEKGGYNLYGTVRNNLILSWDRLGLEMVDPTKITWNDFEGNVPSDQGGLSATITWICQAEYRTQREEGLDESLCWVIKATFIATISLSMDKSKSWTTVTDDNQLLKHEQGHIKLIANILNAWKEKVDKLEGTGKDKNKDTAWRLAEKALFDQFEKLKDPLDEVTKKSIEYDNETNHDMDQKGRQKWEKIIWGE